MPSLLSVLEHSYPGLIANVGTLCLIAYCVSLLGRGAFRLAGELTLHASAGAGVIFGLGTAVLMILPIEVQDGLIFDMRAAVIVVAGPVAGPVAAVIAAGIALISRYYIGGVGMLAGMASLLVSAGVSITYCYIFRSSSRPRVSRLVLAAVMATVLSAPAVMLLPESVRYFVLLDILPFHAVFASLGTLLLASIFKREILRLQHERDLEEQRRIANRATESKSRFLAAMSHEIRTPLNGVLGILQLLKREPLTETGRERLNTAKESGEHLASLINQVLDFARIEAGEIRTNPEPFYLGSLVNSVQSAFEAQAESKSLALEVSHSATSERPLLGDHTQLRQVLYNLVGNAIKFTEQGRVTLSTEVRPEDADCVHVILSVTDTGIGISPDEQTKIFSEFGQAESGEGQGTGLGLAISKRLVENMGGSLLVQSKTGHGSTFTISLILEECAESFIQSGRDQGEKSAGEALSILLVEDNAVNQMVGRALLEEGGHAVTIAGDGRSAVDLITSNAASFDLVFMDIQMPVMNGIDATKEIRRIEPDWRELPIVALTANAFDDQRREYLRAGMNAVLTKPLRVEAIDKVLADLGGHSVDRDRSHLARIDPGKISPDTLTAMRRIMTPEKYDSLLASFEHESRRIAKSLTSCRTSQERMPLAHEWKGLLGNMGLVGAADLASALERPQEIEPSQLVSEVDRIRAIERAGFAMIKAQISD